VEFWLDQDGITEEDVNAIETPAERIPSENEIEPIFISYFVP